MRVFYAACHLLKPGGPSTAFSFTQHRIFAVDEDAARGVAFTQSLKLKPGYAVHEILIMEHVEGVDYFEKECAE